MIQEQNLSFQQQSYLSNPQHIVTIREHIEHLIKHDLQSLEGLLSAVEDTLGSQVDGQQRDELAMMRQKEREFKLLQELSQQNRERSQNITNLAQLTMHLLDFIQEQQHKTQQLQHNYEQSINQMGYTIEQLNSIKVNVENDVQSFKEQLHRAKQEIYQLVQQKENYKDQHQLFQNGWREKDIKIQLLEQELDELRSKINFYKRSSLSKKQLQDRDRPNSLRNVYSQSQFFPISVLQNQCERMTLELSCPNKSQKQICAKNPECQPCFQVQLTKALKKVLSNESLHSLSRKSSQMIQEMNHMEFPTNLLSYEVSTDQKVLDILPYGCDSKKVTYITDEECLSSSPSRDIFDVIGEKALGTAVSTKVGEKSVCLDRNVVPVNQNSFSAPPGPKFVRRGQEKLRNISQGSFAKKGSHHEQRRNPQKSQGLCQSLLKYLVSKRIRRISHKANSGLSLF